MECTIRHLCADVDKYFAAISHVDNKSAFRHAIPKPDASAGFIPVCPQAGSKSRNGLTGSEKTIGPQLLPSSPGLGLDRRDADRHQPRRRCAISRRVVDRAYLSARSLCGAAGARLG